MSAAALENDSKACPRDPGAAVRLLKALKAQNYQFTTPTPATHRRVIARPTMKRGRSLRDVFGWSLSFDRDLLPTAIFETLDQAGGLIHHAHGYRSAFRVSSLADDLLLHSAYPPTAEDAIFFGPDTYRFARFLQQAIGAAPIARLIDIGAGSGAGAIAAARTTKIAELVLADVNRSALSMASINIDAAGLTADYRLSDGLADVDGDADLIIANPPFIAGDGGRTYRDGGDMHGARLSLDWALDAAPRLTPGGRFMLYTGSAIIEGRDELKHALLEQLDARKFTLAYEEIDPDIFGGQLKAAAYADVERIAAIGAVITRRS